MSELFAPTFVNGGDVTPEVQAEMAEALGADSLRYLPVESIARAIGIHRDSLCQACITGNYPPPAGSRRPEPGVPKCSSWGSSWKLRPIP